ncbi:MAG TPA: hypothetical protein VLB45_03665, partial [Nitrosopumilaceae archaeon]|nr:hypothetical protein [Nitrosopumilaceae archaeon]
PVALEQFESNPDYYKSRYDATISWIEKYNHAIISNGPFYLESYSPEARTITIRSFDDPTYPFEAGHWKEFENVNLAKINNAEVPSVVSVGEKITISVSTSENSSLYYYFTNADGKVVDSGMEKSFDGKIDIILSEEETTLFSIGANDLMLFAVSDSALRPDIFQTSFLAVTDKTQMPTLSLDVGSEALYVEPNYLLIFGVVVGIVAIILVLKRKRKQS